MLLDFTDWNKYNPQLQKWKVIVKATRQSMSVKYQKEPQQHEKPLISSLHKEILELYILLQTTMNQNLIASK